MRLPITTVALFSILAIATPAYPAGLTGNNILADCGDTANAPNTACLYWVSGVANGISFAEAASNVRTVCYPTGSTFSQYLDIVIARLKAKPEQRHHPAEATAYAALRAAFPCPKG